MSGLGQRYEEEEKDGLTSGYYGQYGGGYGDEAADARREDATGPEQRSPQPEPRPIVAEPRPVEADLSLLREALSRGIRTPRGVTDIIFFARHPMLKGNPAWLSNGALLDEWRQIRERLVLPELRRRFAPRQRVLRPRPWRPVQLYGPAQSGFGYSAAPVVCGAARDDLNSIAFDVDIINNELAKGARLSLTRMSLKTKLLEVDVDGMISSLDSYIASGCCEPALKTLETEIILLPWPLRVVPIKAKLLAEIIAAQGRARKDFNHC